MDYSIKGKLVCLLLTDENFVGVFINYIELERHDESLIILH